MKKNLLAAIMGAVNAYIQREETGRASSGGGVNNWRFLGQRAQMRARINTQPLRPQPGEVAWQKYRRDDLVSARARLSVGKNK